MKVQSRVVTAKRSEPHETAKASIRSLEARKEESTKQCEILKADWGRWQESESMGNILVIGCSIFTNAKNASVMP